MVVRTGPKFLTTYRSVSYHGADFLSPIFKHGSPVNGADFLVRSPDSYELSRSKSGPKNRVEKSGSRIPRKNWIFKKNLKPHF